MTKEEAKQSLVNTKVYVAGKSAEIQKKLFELGFSWLSEDNTVHLTEMPFICVYLENFSSSQSMTEFSERKSKEVTADYILNLTWEDNKPHYRPFKSAEEVMEAIKEHGDWVMQSGYEHYDRICRVESDSVGTFDIGWKKHARVFSIGYISLKNALEEAFIEWLKENRDKTTIACYADETLAHFCYKAGAELGYKEAVAQAKEWIRHRNRHACKEWLDKECADFEADMNKLWGKRNENVRN